MLDSTTLTMNLSSEHHHPSLQYFPITTQCKNISATCESFLSVILHMQLEVKRYQLFFVREESAFIPIPFRLKDLRPSESFGALPIASFSSGPPRKIVSS